jgi:hypothetical protein
MKYFTIPQIFICAWRITLCACGKRGVTFLSLHHFLIPSLLLCLKVTRMIRQRSRRKRSLSSSSVTSNRPFFRSKIILCEKFLALLFLIQVFLLSCTTKKGLRQLVVLTLFVVQIITLRNELFYTISTFTSIFPLVALEYGQKSCALLAISSACAWSIPSMWTSKTAPIV